MKLAQLVRHCTLISTADFCGGYGGYPGNLGISWVSSRHKFVSLSLPARIYIHRGRAPIFEAQLFPLCLYWPR